MRNPVLESAWTKLDRAREHVVRQKAETEKVMLRDWRSDELNPEPNTMPFTVAIERDDSSADRFRVRVASVLKFDPLIGAIIGDALNNFRSALDHLSWVLYQRGPKVGTLTSGQEKQVQFPIYTDKGSFDTWLPKRIPGVGSMEEAMVRRHQPYTRAHLADDHPLAVLESLNNHDKHREIRPALFLATDYKITADPRESECRILEVIPGPDKDEPLHVDAVLAYIRVADRDACKNTMHVKTQITAYVCIGDRLFLDDTLSQIDGTATDVLTEFDRIL
jgi:hypothetical protein